MDERQTRRLSLLSRADSPLSADDRDCIRAALEQVARLERERDAITRLLIHHYPTDGSPYVVFPSPSGGLTVQYGSETAAVSAVRKAAGIDTLNSWSLSDQLRAQLAEVARLTRERDDARSALAVLQQAVFCGHPVGVVSVATSEI